MGEFLQQIITTLTTYPGNLVYHLILAFSVAGAFQAALNLWRTSGFPQGRRMVIGLGLLLTVRLILFVGALLVGNAFSDSPGLIPVIERTVTALSLILIIWLWVFPEPLRVADIATGLLALLTAAASVFSLLWWSGNGGDLFFNDSWLNIGWEIYSIALIILGIILLLIRKPNAGGVGLAMLGILLAGHLVHLIYPESGGDFAGSVRLAQMAAYPLLLALPHRFQVPTAVEPPTQKSDLLIQERVQHKVTPQVFNSIMSIGAQNTFPEICQVLTETIAETMLADVCLALLPPNQDGHIIVQSGYDLIRQEVIPGSYFERHDIPLILSAMEKSVPLRLPASSTSHDLFSLGSNLQVGRAGHLLASFVKGNDQNSLLGLVLLSPYSNRGWSNEDQEFLSSISDGLAQILHQNQEWRLLQDDVKNNQQNMQNLQVSIEEAKKENAELQAIVNNIKKQTSQDQDTKVVPLPVIPQQSLEEVKRLQAENLRLEELVERLLLENQAQPDSQTKDQLEKELHLAIEQISVLKSKLAVADQELLNLQDGSISPTDGANQDIEVFISIAQELRQPMSSIIGYTDLLLGESIGILGALQKKFLERVKASTERMQVMLDDLLQVVSIEMEQVQLNPELIDLGNIIDEAILATSPQLRDRHIILRVDLPDELPRLQADRDAIGQIFFHLLKNAGDASPIEGEVLLRANTYLTDDNQEYVLIQVADQGGGIPTNDLSRVFTRSYRADNPLVEGIGDTGVGLSIAKTLVEAHNGRIWVDSELGSGSTFSVLIPLLNGNSGVPAL